MNPKIIKIILLLITLSFPMFAQTEYVLADNPVYKFLERMESLHFIERYNSFEIPKTRGEVGNYLKQVIGHEGELDKADKDFLNDYLIEFEFEVMGTFTHSKSLIDGDGFDMLSQNQKYLYFVSDKNQKVNLFFNSAGQAQAILNKYSDLSGTTTATVWQMQLQIRGSLLGKFGFFYRGGNGYVFGQREAALSRRDLQYNYKYKYFGSFDITTAGYLTADFNYVKLKFGRDRMNIGYGPVSVILGDNAPIFDKLYLNLHYKSVEVSYFHGKLLGNLTSSIDSVKGELNIVPEKFIGYHRIGFNLSDYFNIGAAEMIIYGERSLDFDYVNPFILYKTAQNNNKDRDNSLVIIDVNSKPIKGLKLYSMIMIDDIQVDKIGSPYYGNQFIISAGFISNNFYSHAPLDIQFEYVRIDPYVYTNRIQRNTFTNDEYGLGSFMEPNSELFLTQFNYRFTNRLILSGTFTYYIHGANPLNSDGTVKENVGGDILVGYRTHDGFDASLLAGDREYSRKLSLNISYEPIKDFFFTGYIGYINQSLQNAVQKKLLETYLTFYYKM